MKRGSFTAHSQLLYRFSQHAGVLRPSPGAHSNIRGHGALGVITHLGRRNDKKRSCWCARLITELLMNEQAPVYES